MKKEKTITTKEMRDLFKRILEGQNIYNLNGLSRVLLGTFRVNTIYWPSAENTPLTEHVDGMAFYAVAHHTGAILSDESYVYILWPLRSQWVYIVPFEMVELELHAKHHFSSVPQYLGEKQEHFEIDGHPFSGNAMFLRYYRVHRKGLLKTRVASIQFMKDVVDYWGRCDGTTEGRSVWEKKVDYPLFWLDEHKEEITSLKDLDIPDYSKREEIGF